MYLMRKWADSLYGTMSLTRAPSTTINGALSHGFCTIDTMNFKYGYLEIRACVPFRHGAWPSFWMKSNTPFAKCTWYFKAADPAVFLPEHVEDTVQALRAWLKCNGSEMKNFKFSPVKEGLIFNDGVIKVTAFKTLHTACSFTYLVEAENKRVLFGGDMCNKGPAEDFPVSVLDEPLDLAICEAAHFPGTAYLPLFKDCKNLKLLCFTHYSDTFEPSVLEMTRALPDVKVFRATDGMEIDL